MSSVFSIRPAKQLPMLFLVSLLGAGCSSNDPAAKVVIKKGASVRVINMTGGDLEAKFVSRPVTPYTLDSGVAPFVLVPPNMKKLSLVSGPITHEKEIELVGGEGHTIACQLIQGKLDCLVTTGDPRYAEQGAANLKILNTLDKTILIEKPSKIEIQPKSASQVVEAPLSEIELAGISGKEAFKSSKVRPESGGAYFVVVYRDAGSLKAKIVHTNPPMSVMGATQGR